MREAAGRFLAGWIGLRRSDANSGPAVSENSNALLCHHLANVSLPKNPSPSLYEMGVKGFPALNALG